MTDPLDLAKLDELEKAATPGPWRYGVFDSVQLGQPGMVSMEDGTIVFCDNGRSSGEMECADADFIAALRNAYPALRDHISQLRDDRDKLYLERNRLASFCSAVCPGGIGSAYNGDTGKMFATLAGKERKRFAERILALEEMATRILMTLRHHDQCPRSADPNLECSCATQDLFDIIDECLKRGEK